MFFDGIDGLLRVVVVSLCAYAWLVLVLRAAGKRALAKLNAFDLVVTVALGSTLATIILSKDVALAEGAVAFLMLTVLQFAVSKLSVRLGWFRRAVRSEPALLVENGRLLERAMARERVTKAEVEAAVRNQGIGRMEDVGAVVLETDGSMSVLKGERCAMDVLGSVRGVSG